MAAAVLCALQQLPHAAWMHCLMWGAHGVLCGALTEGCFGSLHENNIGATGCVSLSKALPQCKLTSLE